jgi:hypothetical protein
MAEESGAAHVRVQSWSPPDSREQLEITLHETIWFVCVCACVCVCVCVRVCVCVCSAGNGTRALLMLGRCSTTQLHSQCLFC